MRQLFDEYIGVPPPSMVDVPRIVARERRRRSAVIAAGAAFAVALSVGGVVTLRAFASPQVRDPVVAAPVEDPTFALAADEVTERRLTRALDEEVKAGAPGARWLPDDKPPTIARVTGDPASYALFQGFGPLSFDGRKGIVALQILSGLDRTTCADVRQKDPGADCKESTAPGGVRIQSVRNTADQSHVSTHVVQVPLADGHWLRLIANNMYAPGRARPTAAQADPVLTSAKVIAVATAIASRIRP